METSRRPTQWYLRLQNRSTYGPVGMSGLWEWVTQGRITPDDEVSSDGKTWCPAERVYMLNMFWTYGNCSGTNDATPSAEDETALLERVENWRQEHSCNKLGSPEGESELVEGVLTKETGRHKVIEGDSRLMEDESSKLITQLKTENKDLTVSVQQLKQQLEQGKVFFAKAREQAAEREEGLAEHVRDLESAKEDAISALERVNQVAERQKKEYGSMLGRSRDQGWRRREGIRSPNGRARSLERQAPSQSGPRPESMDLSQVYRDQIEQAKEKVRQNSKRPVKEQEEASCSPTHLTTVDQRVDHGNISRGRDKVPHDKKPASLLKSLAK